MNARSKAIATTLRNLADLIEDATDRELIDALDTHFYSGNLERKNKHRKSSRSSKRPLNQRVFLDIERRLRDLTSRDAGRQLIKSELATRSSVEALARHLDLPISTSDTIDILIDKIVELSIGSRLNSEAVQGELYTQVRD